MRGESHGSDATGERALPRRSTPLLRNQPSLWTERLRLRPFVAEDAEPLHLLAERREAKSRTKADSPLRRCLVTLEVILLRARHARRLEARVAVQDAIRETEMLEQVRQLQTHAAGESS